MSDQAKDQEKAAAVLREAVAMLEDVPYDYAVGGGISTDHWTGGVETIGDIDLVIREDDATEILRLLSDAGYETSEMEHSWLHKAFKDDVTIDLMYELKNGTKLDDRFKEHRRRVELFGTIAFVIAPEDQIASLAGTVDPETIGRHWYNIISIMANNEIDWDYLVARAKQLPLRMLSVMYFAMSENVPVQKGVIDRLVELAAADH